MNLVGLAEVADIIGVSKQVVSNWRRRRKDFPKPMQTLAQGPVWKRVDILEWLNKLQEKPDEKKS